MDAFRPPAVPLITVDPYFSVWSFTDELTQDITRHWTGKPQSMVAYAVIDGQAWRLMGEVDLCRQEGGQSVQALVQKSLQIMPLSSVYTFEGGGVRLVVDFTTPLLLTDLDVLSRPVTYVDFTVESIDGAAHQVQIYYDVSAEICVHTSDQEVVWFTESLSDGSRYVRMGTHTQAVLERKGDAVRIDWGYAYVMVPGQVSGRVAVIADDARRSVAETGQFDAVPDTRMPRAVQDDMPLMAAYLDLGTIAQQKAAAFLILAYDDIYCVEYFHKRLPAYWRRTGMSFSEMLTRSASEHADIRSRCAAVNNQVITDARRSGGEKYADITSLAYRQAIAAHKLTFDEEGRILFFSKENSSNGCMGTVDVSYPSIPLFLLYCPELVKGMLRPVFRYASSDQWPCEFAPHDVGLYPIANGQVYGMDRETQTPKIDRQMPIEECGNMLIMTTAIALMDNSPEFAEEHWPLLSDWATYLHRYGMDPSNQLCTDDFGGHLAHNANLSIKAIIAIASFGLLCGIRGDEASKQHWIAEAKEMASRWEEMASDSDHYRLSFDVPGSWSLKYNLVWDRLFSLDLFPSSIREKEIAHYLRMRNRYGTPLDNRNTYTKADWLVWAAALAERQDHFEAMIEPLWHFLNEGKSRVPFSDLYYTIEGEYYNCISRSVVGGVFIKILMDKIS